MEPIQRPSMSDIMDHALNKVEYFDGNRWVPNPKSVSSSEHNVENQIEDAVSASVQKSLESIGAIFEQNELKSLDFNRCSHLSSELKKLELGENVVKFGEITFSFKESSAEFLAKIIQEMNVLFEKRDKLLAVLAAVKEDGMALKYADSSLRENKEVVLAAVTQFGRALNYANLSLKKDKEVGLAATKRHVLSSGGLDARLLEFDIY